MYIDNTCIIPQMSTKLYLHNICLDQSMYAGGTLINDTLKRTTTEYHLQVCILNFANIRTSLSSLK